MVDRKRQPAQEGNLEQLSRVELELENRLAPVQPDPEFIRDLHTRLTAPPGMGLEQETHLSDLLIALGVAGGGILILVVMLRLVYEVLKAVGVIRTSR